MSVHDVGKLALPESLLLKRKPLKLGEQGLMTRTPVSARTFYERFMPDDLGAQVKMIVRFKIAALTMAARLAHCPRAKIFRSKRA